MAREMAWKGSLLAPECSRGIEGGITFEGLGGGPGIKSSERSGMEYETARGNAVELSTVDTSSDASLRLALEEVRLCAVRVPRRGKPLMFSSFRDFECLGGSSDSTVVEDLQFVPAAL